ncbi:amidohydrolase family protein [Blastococcus sp. SYSU DS0539]
MRRLLLHRADQVLQSSTAAVPDGAVLIEGREIRDVGRSEELERRYPGAERLDCTGLMLVPGFVNGHNHAYEVLCRGIRRNQPLEPWLRELIYPVTRRLTAEDYRHGALLAAAEAFRTGTTSIVSQLTNFARFHADSEAEAFRSCGMRARVARASSTASTIDPAENGEPEAELRDTEAFLDRWSDGDLVRGEVGPAGLFSCDPQTLRALKQLATAHGGQYYVHLAETRGQQQAAVRAGYRGQIDWADRIGLLDERTVVAHAVWISPAEVAVLAGTGSMVVHNPGSNMVLASGVADLGALRRAGVRVSVATDGPASNDSQDMVAEMKTALLLQRVTTLRADALEPADVFAMATEAGAPAMGLDGRIGRLEPGYLADLAGVRIAGNPALQPVTDPVASLVLAGSGRDVALTMVDGRIVYRDGTYPTLDLAATLTHVRERTMPTVHAALGIRAGSPRAAVASGRLA